MTLSKNYILALTAVVISVISSLSVQCQESSVVSEKQLSHDHSREEISKKFECPSTSGRYPHPQSCEHYFECRSGRPTLKYCSRGDLYDEEREECRDRRRVNCRRDERKDDEDVISKKFDCPAVYGRFPHPQSCEYYFECRSGRSTLKHCSRGDLYDEDKEECRDKKKVQCRRDGNGEDEDDERDNDFKCPYPSGSFAHPIDCSKYYVCRYNLPSLFQCQNSELFDERARRCLYKYRVNCGKRLDRESMKTSRRPVKSTTTTPVSTTTEATTEAITVSTIKEVPITTASTTPEPISTTTPEPTTTTTLESTTTSEPISTKTPEPTTTSTPESTTTSTPEPTTSTTLESTTTPEPISTTTPEQTTTSTPESTTISTLETTTSTTPEPTTTVTPEPTTTTTPESPVTTTETASSTTESTTVTEFPVTKPNTPPPTDCDKNDLDCIIDDTGDVKGWFDCPERYGHFPHGSSKQLFIHCDNGKPFVKKCADGTEFSPEHLVCVWVH